MRELSLFTGIGGGLLGAMLLGWRTVAAVEYEPYCQRVLCARGGYMADATGERVRWPRRGEQDARDRWADSEPRGAFPIYPDVRTFHPEPGSCDIVTGGFPCQPFSQAGKRLGADDPRNMWPHTVRVLVESGAPLGFFENVPGLLSSGYFGTVLGDLAEAGFDAEWCVLGADDVGAPHRRKRLWILAVRHGYDAGMHARAVGAASQGPGRDAALDLLAGRGEVPDGGAGDVAHSSERRGERRRSGREPSSGGRSLRLPAGPDCDGGPWHIDPADVGHTDEPGPQGHGRLLERAGELTAGTDGGAEYDEWLLEPYVGRPFDGLAEELGRQRDAARQRVLALASLLPSIPYAILHSWDNESQNSRRSASDAES